MELTLSSLLLALAAAAAAGPVPRDADVASATKACQNLYKQFPDQLYLPGNDNYTTQRLSVWSETCITTPYCVFQPTSAKNLAKGLEIIVDAKSLFSVRGQGHMPVPGSNGVNNGVFISMANFNKNKLVENNSVVQIGSGQAWKDVYEFVSPYGLGVAGGRYSPVGVGGLLLGGGINYFGSQVGWSFNTVINYEVVLANGTIVYANATSNPDLFWALKGGGNNFGIVTRYDMKTIPATKIYGGTIVHDPAYCDQFLDALQSFVLPGGGSYDPKAAVVPFLDLDPASNSSGCATLAFYGDDVPVEDSPAALANFTAIPALSTDASVRISFVNYTNETNIPSYSSDAYRWLFASTAIKVSPNTVALLNQTYTSSVLAELTKLTNTTGSSSDLSMQPITVDWLQAAKNSGGDAIDLDPANGPFIAVLIVIQWTSAADDARVNAIASDFISRLDTASKAAGLYYPFRYMNDAMHGQEIYSFYGGGASLPKLKAIQQKYDPAGILANYEQSGFKL